MSAVSEPMPVLEKWAGKLAKLSGYLSAFFLTAMVIMVLAEIGSRLAVDRSLFWEYEGVTYSLPILGFAAMAYAQRHEAHISVSILTDRLSEWQKKVWDIVVYCATLLFVVIFTRWFFLFAEESFTRRETGWGTWGPPIYPVKIIVAATLVILAIQLLADLLSAIYRLCKQPAEAGNHRNLLILGSLFAVALVVGIMLTQVSPMIGIFWFIVILILFGIPIYAGLGHRCRRLT